MKIYLHMNAESFSNCYIVVNEKTKQAIIIDPAKITNQMIKQIEDNSYKPVAVLITHNHPGHTKGLSTLLKIYECEVYAVEQKISGIMTTPIHGDGCITVADLHIEYMSVPGHTPDSLVFKIGNTLFTGDVIGAGTIGETNSNYSKMILKKGINQKILSLNEDISIMPGHGPLTCVAAERSFNIDI
ncbi:MBL fold metallo-hydrolase [Treponema pectinovorum]|uniref:MBL fold metallo-hydrolase n=1 Tax=Treponema pectinovorum TaxID=164 RepID=UPI0011C9F7A4|nr:MBL fold metallo-hydrolase [Treponema pectinovorum]